MLCKVRHYDSVISTYIGLSLNFAHYDFTTDCHSIHVLKSLSKSLINHAVTTSCNTAVFMLNFLCVHYIIINFFDR